MAQGRLIGVAVDLVVFAVREQRLEVALIGMKSAPFFGRWALPGGRLRGSETVEEAAVRELREKTGLSDVYFEQLHAFSGPDRDPRGRVVSIAFMALLPGTAQLRTTDNYSAIGWFPARRPPKLAFDHAEVLAFAIARLRDKLHHSNVAYSLMDPSFTMSDLRRTYEAVTSLRFDPRNFQKRVLQLELVEDTGKLRRGGKHRPARLFRFAQRRPMPLRVIA
jgi:8-oxo-dGTP diphosphatase